MIESGFPGFEVLYWYGLFAPRQVPPGVVSALGKHLQAALASASGEIPQGLTDGVR